MLDALGDDVVATRTIPDVHLIPGLGKIDGYGKILDTLHSSACWPEAPPGSADQRWVGESPKRLLNASASVQS